MKGSAQPQQRSIKRLLIVLALLFLLPLAFMWVYYADSSSSLHHHKAQHGVFLHPNITLAKLPLKQQDGNVLNGTFFYGHWTLMMLNPGVCEKHCLHDLTTLRKLTIAMAPNAPVSRVVLSFPKLKNNAHLEKILDTQFPQVKMVLASKANAKRVLGQHTKSTLALSQGALYVINPKGDAIMFYHPSAAPSDMFREILQLM